MERELIPLKYNCGPFSGPSHHLVLYCWNKNNERKCLQIARCYLESTMRKDNKYDVFWSY